MIIRLTNQQLALLEKEARRVYPFESCALLFGKLKTKEAVVERIVITQNVLRSATHFEIDSKAFYDAFIEADQEDLEFIGFFHSHPAPPEPSNVDIKFMNLWGDAVWLIFSSDTFKFAAFQMKNRKVQTLTLKTDGKFKE